MNRRPLGSIDPNSIRETELHTECRRRRERESLYSPQHDRDRDAARQRAVATRRRETDEARAERLRANRQRKATRRQQETTQAREARCVCIRPGMCLSVCVSVLRALVARKKVRLQKSFRSIVIVHHAADRKQPTRAGRQPRTDTQTHTSRLSLVMSPAGAS